MYRAELINFMAVKGKVKEGNLKLVELLNFIKNPGLIVFYSVVFNSLPYQLFLKPIYNFYLICIRRKLVRSLCCRKRFTKVDQYTRAGAAGYVCDFVGLDCELYLMAGCDSRDHEIETRMCLTCQECTSSRINANMPLFNLMYPTTHNNKYKTQSNPC